MNRLFTLIAVTILGIGQLSAQTHDFQINHGSLQSDLKANGHKILTTDLSDYAGTNMSWNVTTNKFDATASGTGAPGGSSGAYQYNLTGGFAAVPGVTYNGTIPMSISMTGLNTSQTGVFLQNSTVTTVDGVAAAAPAIIFRQHAHWSGADHIIEHKLEARDTVLAIQSRIDGSAWSPGMAFLPTFTGTGQVSEYNGDISITAAVIFGLDDVSTGGDGGHPARVGMFNNSTTSRAGISMKYNSFFGWASPASGETYQSWEANNDTIIDRPAAGVARIQNAMELIPVAVSALPAPSLGRIAVVNDGAASLAWGATVTGGGSSKYYVWYNGTNWTVTGK